MKVAGARGMTRSRIPLIAMLALAATMGLAGCDGDSVNDAVGPTGPVGPDAASLALSPSQPARPIVAASASIAIKGMRDRVIPRAPATFMDDSQARSMRHRSQRPTESVTRRPYAASRGR